MKTIVTAAIAAALLCALNAKAQSDADYVITTNGDTIACKIFYGMFGNINYRVNENADKVTINPKQIKEYHDAKNNYLVRAVYPEGKQKPEFFYAKIRGTISLYEQKIQQGWYTQKIWYFSKGNDVIYKLKANVLGLKSREERKNKLGDMLKDDPILYEKYTTDDKFTFDQILELIREYDINHPLVSKS